MTLKNTVKTVAASAVALGAAAIPFAVGAAPVNFGLDVANNIGLGTRDLRQTIVGVVQTAMGFLGILAVIVILYGGFLWMTAGGEEAKVKKARNMITQGIIGLVIIILSFAIATFVINQITNVS